MTEIQEGLTMVDSRVIGLIASKRNFDITKEMKYIEKAKTSKCRCKHWTQTNPCFFHTCRHSPKNHYGLEKMSDIFTDAESWAALRK